MQNSTLLQRFTLNIIIISNNLRSERVANNQNSLNENIHNIARFLIEQNKATATQQDEFAKYYSKVILQKNVTLINAQEKKKQYKTQLSRQLYRVEVAGQQLKQELKDEAFKLTIATVVDTVMALFTKKASQVIGLLRSVGKIKNALEVKDTFSNLMNSSSTGGDLTKAIDHLNNIDSESIADTFPTEMDWNEFDLKVDNTLARTYVSGATDFKIEAHKYTMLGRQYLATLQQICQLQYDIAINIMKQEVHTQQSDRLRQISNIVDQHRL